MGAPPTTGQFKKGNPGGPGRPKGSKNFTTILDKVCEYLKEHPDKLGVDLPEGMHPKELIVMQQIIKAASMMDLDSAKWLFERDLGKPKQAIDHTSKDEKINSMPTIVVGNKDTEDKLKKLSDE